MTKNFSILFKISNTSLMVGVFSTLALSVISCDTSPRPPSTGGGTFSVPKCSAAIESAIQGAPILDVCKNSFTPEQVTQFCTNVASVSQQSTCPSGLAYQNCIVAIVKQPSSWRVGVPPSLPCELKPDSNFRTTPECQGLTDVTSECNPFGV